MKPCVKHIMYSLCFVLGLCLTPKIWAQEQTINFEVKIKDSFTRKDLPKAKVLLYEADSVTPIDAQVTPNTYTQMFSNSEAEKTITTFYITAPGRTKYIAKVSMDGYIESSVAIDVQKNKKGIFPKEVSLKDILLHKDYSAQDLGEATVTASRVAMVVKGDTVEYDARAFRVGEGSMLNKLFIMLPGVKVNDEGEITLNGEYVHRLLLNGNRFFNGDAKIALDNLPAYVVDKLKFYHEGPEWEYLLDRKNKYYGKKPLVVDVRLKRDYNAGWITNAELAGGSKLRDADKMLYLARLFAMRYTENSILAGFGMANNLGDKQSPGQKGLWKKISMTTGERDSRTGGANITLHGKRTDTDFNSSIVVTNEDMNRIYGSTSLSRYGISQTRRLSNSTNNGVETNLNWNSSLSLKQKIAYTRISTKLSYRYDNKKSTYGYTSDIDSLGGMVNWQRTYTRQYNSNTHKRNWFTSLSFQSEIKSPISHKLYSLSGGIEYKKERETDLRRDTYESNSQNWDEFRHDIKPLNFYKYYIGVSRNIFDITTKNNFGLRANAEYRYMQQYNRNVRNRALCDTLGERQAALMPSATSDEVWVHDEINSLHTTDLTRTHAFFADAQISNYKFIWNTSIWYYVAKRYIFDYRNMQETNFKHDDSGWQIHSDIYFNKIGLSIAYNMTPQYALTSYLVPGNDAYDRILIYQGNAVLKNPLTHKLGLGKKFVMSKHNRMLNININWSRTKNAIARVWNYDVETGMETSRPINVNGNWQTEGTLRYGQNLGRKKRWEISTESEYYFTHYIDYSNTSLEQSAVRGRTNNWRWEQELKLNYRTTKGYMFTAKATAAYEAYNSRPIQTNFDNGIWDYTYGVSLQVPIGKRFLFSTDMMAYAHRKYYDEKMNRTEWVWNAEIEYSVGKKKKWVIRAVGFDLLHQQSSIRRTKTPQGYTETWCNTTPSFATLHIVYNFNKERKKAN